MKYTIKGKDYSELDIKKRCAELMGLSDIFLNPDTKVLCVGTRGVTTDEVLRLS